VRGPPSASRARCLSSVHGYHGLMAVLDGEQHAEARGDDIDRSQRALT
jgi:hypothetical protein